MAKKLPVYSICSINGGDKRTESFMAARFADYVSERGYLLQPHGHSFYHLVLFTDGGGEQSIDFSPFPVKAGQIYFMTPGQVHSWNFKGTVDGYIVNFTGELFNDQSRNNPGLNLFSFFSGNKSDQVLQLNRQTKEAAIAIFETLLAEAKQGGNFHADMLRSLLVQLFITVSRQVNPERTALQGRPGSIMIRNFKSLVNTHYHELKLPSDYAALLYVTPNYLNSLSKDLLGKPAGEVIRDRIMLEAKRLLVNADKTISEIAAALQFPDNSYFTKFFKKYAEKTPEEFRKTFHIN
jgi:AraC family transcriptional activator of pobA